MVQILFYFIERPLYKVKSSGRIVLRQRKMLPGGSQQQAAYPAVPDTFLSEKACLFLVVKEIPGCYNKEEKSELRTGSGKMKEVF